MTQINVSVMYNFSSSMQTHLIRIVYALTYPHSLTPLALFFVSPRAKKASPPLLPSELNRPSAAENSKVSPARKETSGPRDARPVAQLGWMID